jgi:hypothetical protein
VVRAELSRVIGRQRIPLPSWVHRATVPSRVFDSVPPPAIRYGLSAPFQTYIQEETCPTVFVGLSGGVLLGTSKGPGPPIALNATGHSPAWG